MCRAFPPLCVLCSVALAPILRRRQFLLFLYSCVSCFNPCVVTHLSTLSLTNCAPFFPWDLKNHLQHAGHPQSLKSDSKNQKKKKKKKKNRDRAQWEHLHTWKQ